METKHTKGEWIVGIDNKVYANNGDELIATVKEDFNISKLESEANAKLISSAPQLLESLLEAKEIIEILSTNKANDGSVIGKVLNNIQESIKKATE